jgi:hypothetical protein
MTEFHKREYDVQFWVGKAEPSPPWVAARWLTLRRGFDAVVQAGRQPTKLRSSQIDPATKKYVAFGKLTWSVEGDKKWVLVRASDRYFENVEMWAPNPTICKREDRAPDTYFDVTNIEGAGGYDWFAVAALASDIPEPTRRSIVEGLHVVLSLEFSLLWSAIGRRPWGFAWGDGFDQGMQELSHTVAWNLKRSHGDFSLDLLRGNWKRVDGPAV